MSGMSTQGRMESPADLGEASTLIHDTAGTLLFRGAGTKQQWGGRVPDPEMILDTTAMTGVLTYNPADLTASVRAGTPLTELQEAVGEHGQWFASDAPSARRGATVGGLLASGDSGPARLRYGGMRDLVIGATLVLADGSVARSGGHVIKNVAGYDLTKVLHGSLGSLALVAEVVVRLHPRPSEAIATTAAADAASATAATLALMAGPLEPTAIDWISNGPDGAHGELVVRMDGAAGPVATASEAVVTLLADHGLDATTHSREDSAEVWTRHVGEVLPGEEDTVLRVSGLPSELEALAARVEQLAADAGVSARIASQAGLGLHTLRISGTAPATQAELVEGVRTPPPSGRAY